MNKYNVTFTPTAFEDYKYWQTQDKKLLKKINSLIKSIQRNGILEGEGKPDPLKANLKCYFRTRKNHEHRKGIRIKENRIIIIPYL